MMRFVTGLFFCFLAEAGYGQKWDIGLHGGMAGYLGEINQRNPVLFNRPDIGFHVRRNLNPDFSIRLGVDHAWVHGDDAKSGSASQIQRNLNFTSTIDEATLVFEFNLFKFNPFDAQENFSPYLMAGIGAFIYNPYTYLNGQRVALRPVGTEGQFLSGSNRLSYYPSPYSTFSWNIPVGFGIKYHLGGHLSLTMEYGFRFTFTDYLDDIGGLYPNLASVPSTSLVSQLSNRSTYAFMAGDQRGDSRKYDKYFFANAGLTYTFRSIDCPKFAH